jgi:hypothetical protein
MKNYLIKHQRLLRGLNLAQVHHVALEVQQVLEALKALEVRLNLVDQFAPILLVALGDLDLPANLLDQCHLLDLAHLEDLEDQVSLLRHLGV